MSLIGHSDALAWLRRALRTGRFAHAYLITGPRSVGKRTFALEIAQALNLDLKVVRMTLTPRERQRQIVQRTAERNVPETYEYACPSVSHAPDLTPSPTFLASGSVD